MDERIMKRRISWGMSAVIASVAGAAHCAERADNRQPSFETVVVTAASGRAEHIIDVPQTIDIVSPEVAAAAQPTWIGEVLNKLPGVYFAQLRGPVDMPAVRLPQSSDNTVLFLQDNVPLQSAISFSHSAFAYSAALTSPGGMEVLKGPGTALHGSDAFAAVVNVKSLAPTQETTAAARIGAGSYGTREARFEYSDGIDDSQAWRIAVSHQQADGWRDHSDWERTQGLARHRWELERTVVDTVLVATDFQSSMAGALPFSVYRFNPRSDGLDARVPRDRARDRAKYLRLSSEITHELSGTYRLQVTPYVRSIDASYLATWEPATVPIIEEKTESVGLISRLYADWSQNSQSVVGFDVERTELEQPKTQFVETTTVWGEVYPIGRHYDYAVDYLNLAPYMQHTQRLGEAMEMVLGLRYERARYDYDNRLPAGARDAFYRPADRRDEFDAINPKFALNWSVAPGQSVFVRYAHGFRIPAATTLYALSSSQTAFSLDPEQIDSYELGYRALLGQRANLTVAAYLMRSYDGLTADVATAAGTVSANGGKREHSGLELQLEVRLTDSLSASLAAAWQDSKIVRDRPDGSDPRGVDGRTPRGQSDKLANLSLVWTPSVGGRELGISYDLQLLGSWWIDDQNTARTPDELISNLRLQAELGRGWSITMKVLNLFERQYATTAIDAGYGALYRPGEPRTFTAGVEYTLQ